MFNFKKYFIPMSQYMAAQTQIMQLTAKKDSLEADIAELKSSFNAEMEYHDRLIERNSTLIREIDKTAKELKTAKDCVKVQKYLLTLFLAVIIGELFVISALI